MKRSISNQNKIFRARFSSIFFIFLVSLCLVLPAYGAPSISGVKGLVMDGQTLTVSGLNLMDENRTSWDATGGVNFKTGTGYGFEGSSFLSDGWEPGQSGSGSLVSYDTNVKLSGNKSAKCHIQGQHTATIDHNPRASFDNFYGSPNHNEVWVRGYGRWDLLGGSWPTEYIKMFWTSRNPEGYIVFQPSTGNGTPEKFFVSDGWNGSEGTIPSGQLESGRWYCFEIHILDESGGTRVTAWIDGKQIAQLYPATGDLTMNWFEFGITNLDGTGSNFNLNHYWDNVAISLTDRVYPASKIEIGTSPVYGQGNEKYQEPVYLSDNSVQIKVDLSGLGSGPYYLWITNNRQERSAAYPVGMIFSTTYNCPEWTGSPGNALNCDNLFYGGSHPTEEGHEAQITSAANYPGGGGGRGHRHWIGQGAYSNYTNPIAIPLPAGVTEMWMRFYLRFQQGLSWESYDGVKIIYAHDPFYIQFAKSLWPCREDAISLYPNVSGSDGVTHDACDVGFKKYWGDPSNGSWHSFEYYIKSESVGSNNGILRFWMDGSLIHEETNIDYGLISDGRDVGTVSNAYLEMGSNTASLCTSGCSDKYIDFDDIYVTNLTPSNRDALGNPMIGPIGSGGDDADPPVSPVNLIVR